MSKVILNIANNYFGTVVYADIIDVQRQLNFETKTIIFQKLKHCSGLKIPNNCLLLIENDFLNDFFRFFPHLRFLYHKQKIIDFISSSEIMFVHSHTLHSNGCLGYSICQHYNLQHIISLRNTDVNYAVKYMWHLYRRYLKILRSAKYITAPNRPYASFIKQKFDVHVRLLQNPINLYWENLFPKLSSVPKDFMVLNVCSIGAVNRNKNQLAVLRALQVLEKKCRFYLIGKIEDTTYYTEMQSVISNSCVEMLHVDHLSSKCDLANLLCEMDVMCLPSFKETFGLSYIESAMTGVPVVYSQGQAIDGILAEGTIGYAADPRSVLDIKEAIRRCILLDNSHVSKMAKKQFGRSKYVETLGALYD